MTTSFAGAAGSAVSPTRLSGGRLSAIRHLPAEAARGACVMCPPAFHEYQLCQRTLRVLAERLCAAGVAVSRVDVRGVGDSLWGAAPATLEAWVSDALAAADDLARVSGVGTVEFFGLRAGAIVALEAATRSTDGRAFLWELPSDGAHHLRELESVQAAWFAAYRAQHGRDHDPGAATAGIAGHRAPAELLESLAAWRPPDGATAARRFATEPVEGAPEGRAADRSHEVVRLPGPAPWRVTIDIAAPPVPAGALERIARAVAEAVG